MERASATAKRTRRPSDGVAERLLDAAAVEFAAHGYEGAATRRIAERADAHQPQINYHFASKELLWQATVDRLFAELDAETAPAVEVGDPEAVLGEALRGFLRFSAARPELNRIINQEATAPSPRLDWLLATHLRPRFTVVAAAWAEIRAGGRGAELTAGDVWELVTGYGALHFANAPMHEGLGLPAGDPEAHARRLLALLLPTR